MNAFDYEIIKYLNQFSTHSWAFDKIVGFLSGQNLYKGGFLVALLWWGWFKDFEKSDRNRRVVIVTLISSIVAIFVGRFMALLLPFRLRPLHEEALNFVLPFGMDPTNLEGWSAFPSDHTVLFFAIAVGLLFISRPVGILAIIYTALVNGFARVYVGFHYPSDILVGAAIGALIVTLNNCLLIKTKPVSRILAWSQTVPQIYYPLFFLLTYQIGDVFSSSRATVNGLKELIEKVVG